MSDSEAALCWLEEPADGATREFLYATREGRRERGFLVCMGGKIHAYRNACPHVRAPLNGQPNQFLDVEGRYILCSLHGALFGIEDGLCVAGPCRGQGLEKLAVRWEEGRIIQAEWRGNGPEQDAETAFPKNFSAGE
jgi:nitrite reductase/ring-hydroxylating ferredoxin subunit